MIWWLPALLGCGPNCDADVITDERCLRDDDTGDFGDDHTGLDTSDTDVRDRPDDAVDPGAPVWGDAVGTVTATIRTATGTFAGSDADIALCLGADECFRLDTPDLDDLRVGGIDVYAWEGLSLSRAALDRVELRWIAGSDQWDPACVQLAFDGEPVYCNDDLADVEIGETTREKRSWVDPGGLQLACDTCFRSVLTHGPMKGAVDPDATRLWVRTDATRQVRLRLSFTDEEVENGWIADYAYPGPHRDFTAVLRATQLLPSTFYRYAVEVDGAEQARGMLKTAPEAGTPVQARLDVGSCAKDEDQSIFGAIYSEAPDLFLFLGDNHYGNTANVDALRHYYRWSLERPERAILAELRPTLATWDDHDFVGNNTDGTAPGKDRALRVFQEYWANPSAGIEGVPGVFFSYGYGDVDLFFVDGRYWRGLEGSLIGTAQTAWLLDALAGSTATFKLVASGSQFTSAGLGDSWAEYPEARDAFFAALDDRAVDGVVLLSGDVHRSELRLLQRARGYALPEITASPLATFVSPCFGFSDELITCYDGGNSYVRLDVDTTAADPSITATILNERGVDKGSATFFASELR